MNPRYVLEYQEGSVEQHFQSVRDDLTASEVVEAFCAYMDGNAAWRYPFEFEPKVIQPPSYRAGVTFGQMLRQWFGPTRTNDALRRSVAQRAPSGGPGAA